MNPEEDHIIGQFLRGELSKKEEEDFQELLQNDAELAEKVALEKQLFETFNDQDWSHSQNPNSLDTQAYTELFDSHEAQNLKKVIAESEQSYIQSKRFGKTKRLWVYAVAGMLLALAVFYFLRPENSSPESLYRSYLEKTELPSLITRSDAVSTTELLKGQEYFENKVYEQAIEVFLRLIEKEPQNAAILIKLALSQTELGRFKEAEEVLNQLISSDLLDAEKGFWYKALMYLKANEIEKSKAQLRVIIKNTYYNYHLANSLLSEIE